MIENGKTKPNEMIENNNERDVVEIEVESKKGKYIVIIHDQLVHDDHNPGDDSEEDFERTKTTDYVLYRAEQGEFSVLQRDMAMKT